MTIITLQILLIRKLSKDGIGLGWYLTTLQFMKKLTSLLALKEKLRTYNLSTRHSWIPTRKQMRKNG